MRPTIALILLALAPVAGAQERVSSPAFISETVVNNVTVDIRVRDAQGVPVSGLGRDDFRIFENDVEQPVTNFLAVDGGAVSGSPDASLVGQPAPRQILIFFDLYLLTEPDKRRILDSLRSQVDAGLPPAETMAVVSFDGTLRVHTPPTASREKLLDAFKQVERQSATGLQRQMTLATFNVNNLPRRESWSTYNYRRAQNAEYWNELRRMVGRVETAFTAAMQRFSSTASRKVVLLVSPGFPRTDNLPVYREYDFWLDAPLEYRNAGLLGRSAYLASELEYTLFTLDPSGNQTRSIDASYGPPPAFTDVANVNFWREADRKDSLIRAARFTGGDAIFSSDGGAAFSDVERLTSSYYSLAYQPEHAGDGKEYSIRAEVVGHRDYQLTYRTRYVDRPLEARDAERTRAALLTGDETNPLGIELVLDRPTSRFKLGAQGMKVYKIAAELRIPYQNLTMIPRGDIAWGQLQIVVLGVDGAGNQSQLNQLRIPVEVPAQRLAEARAKGYFAYTFNFELEGGASSLRVAVNDTLGHTTSALIADLKL